MTISETFTENRSKNQLFSVVCVECSRPTRHRVAASLDKDGSDFDEENGSGVEWRDNYQVIQCQGCETVTFRHLSWFSEDVSQTLGEDGTTERLYPKRDAISLMAMSLLNAPTNLRRIYREVIDSFNIECLTLCAAGLRAMVEGICASQAIADGPVNTTRSGGGMHVVRKTNLEGKIFGLHEKGHLTLSNAEILHQHRYLGNEAVHELAKPSSDELRRAIEILEHIVKDLYEMPEKALELKRATAERKKKI